MIRFALIAIITCCAMEGVSYLAHRYVYHKLLWVFHRSHHRPRKGAFELNDIFPLFFSAVCIVLMSMAVQAPDGNDLLALGVGIAMYGTVYFVIHDLYVHRRARWLTFRVPYLQRVKKAHMIHHLYGGEPYGLLVFPLPRHLREKREILVDADSTS
jgi:beta-carotene 3-hydroxylase